MENLPIPTHKISPEKLPTTPPPGVATTTDTTVNTKNFVPPFTPKGTKIPGSKSGK